MSVILIYLSYLVVNLLAIPVHILFVLSMFMGMINEQSESVTLFLGLLVYALILNTLNFVLLATFRYTHKEFTIHNVIAFAIFSFLTIGLYIGFGWFIF